MSFYEKYNPWVTTLIFSVLYFVFSIIIINEVSGEVDVPVVFVYTVIFGVVYFFVAKFVMNAKF